MTYWRALILAGIALLAGCTQVAISPAGGVATSSSASGLPPSISGTPAVTAPVGSAYRFSPTASSSGGASLNFSIRNKPSWASFNVTTGQLAGTPTTADLGSYNGIAISVSDGGATAQLPAFTVLVVAPGGTGTATLQWAAPTLNTDGSPLTDLTGYWVLHGPSADQLTHLAQITDPGATAYRVSGLGSGSHYFAVAAYNSLGIESAPSNVGSKSIP